MRVGAARSHNQCNCIVVDHGYGLQTIYGHLSQIAVHEDDMVKRGQVMGTSGMTGMAAGGHIALADEYRRIAICPWAATDQNHLHRISPF